MLNRVSDCCGTLIATVKSRGETSKSTSVFRACPEPKTTVYRLAIAVPRPVKEMKFERRPQTQQKPVIGTQMAAKSVARKSVRPPADRTPLIVWRARNETSNAAKDGADAAILEALKTRFDLDLRDRLPEVGNPDADPEMGPDTRPETPDILLLCPPPAEVLCRAMADNIAPSVALQDWQAQTQAILRLNRQNRRKVRLVDTTMIARHPKAFLQLFELPERVDVIASLSASGSASVSGGPSGAQEEPANGAADGDQVILLLAQRTLLGDMRARTLMGELEAACVDLSDGTPETVGDPDAAFRAWQNIRQARLEADLLQAQQRAMHEEMEILYNSNQRLEQRLDQLGQGLESYQAQVQDLHAEQAGIKARMADKDRAIRAAGDMIRDLETRAAQLDDQLHRVRDGARDSDAAKQRHIEALEETGAQKQQQIAALEETGTQKQQHVEALEGEIHRITTSRSFRLTAPLRGMRALVARKDRP